jgi:hypothetical protein
MREAPIRKLSVALTNLVERLRVLSPDNRPQTRAIDRRSGLAAMKQILPGMARSRPILPSRH